MSIGINFIGGPSHPKFRQYNSDLYFLKNTIFIGCSFNFVNIVNNATTADSLK